MGDRTTGATDKQIEAAYEIRRRKDQGYGDATLRREAVVRHAEALVPTTHRIVSADDLSQLADYTTYWANRLFGNGLIPDAHEAGALADRIRALIGER